MELAHNQPIPRAYQETMRDSAVDASRRVGTASTGSVGHLLRAAGTHFLRAVQCVADALQMCLLQPERHASDPAPESSVNRADSAESPQQVQRASVVPWAREGRIPFSREDNDVRTAELAWEQHEVMFGTPRPPADEFWAAYPRYAYDANGNNLNGQVTPLN